MGIFRAAKGGRSVVAVTACILASACGSGVVDRVAADSGSATATVTTDLKPSPPPLAIDRRLLSDPESTQWQVTVRAEEAESIVRRLAAGRIGAVKFDNARQVLVVHIVGLTPAMEQVIRRTVPSTVLGNLELKVARYNYDDLMAVQRQAHAIASRYPFADYVGDGFDPDSARVFIELAPGATDLARALEAELPAQSFFIRTGKAGIIELQEQKYEPNPNGQYKAAKHMTDYNCTSGFVYTQGASFLGSTAGHCVAGDGDQMRVGVVEYGFGFGNTFPFYQVRGTTQYMDSVFIKGNPSTNYTPNLVHVNASYTRKVNSKNPNAVSGVGSRVYQSGYGVGGEYTGTITGVQRTVTDGNGEFRYGNVTTTNYFSQPGDSGGPVYQKVGDTHAKAIGAHVGVYIDGAGFSPFYYDIDDIERETGALVLMY